MRRQSVLEARIVAVAGLLVAALAISGCEPGGAAVGDDNPGQAGADAVRVETVLAETRDLAHTVEMPATVEGFETADLYAKIGGYLAKMHVDIGDQIRQGQELARLWIPEMDKQLKQKQALIEQAEADVAQAEAAVAQSEADLDSTQAALDEAKTERGEKQAGLAYRQADHKRYQELVESKAVRRELLDQAKFQLDAAEAALGTVEARIRTAEARLNGARANLAKAKADLKSAQARVDVARADAEYVREMMQYGSIEAPFDGMVTKRWFHPGAFIQPAEGNSAARPLLTVTRTDVVRISLDIPMSDVRLLDRGDRAVLDRINVLPGESFEGEVTRFSAALDKNSRMMRVEIDLANGDGRLRPGYYGYVTIYLDEYPNTPVVPSSALLAEGDDRYVYVVEDGAAHKTKVMVNYQDGAIVGISSGLEGGEEIVRAGGGLISDGQAVTAIRSD